MVMFVAPFDHCMLRNVDDLLVITA